MLNEIFTVLLTKYSNDNTFVESCWKEIQENYSSPKRFYHNLEHLENMLIELEPLATKIENMDAILFTIFYHDIIYKPSSSSNELDSAKLFEERIGRSSFKDVKLCFDQILATKEHEASHDHDTNMLLDIDMSILGKEREVYINYARNIRKEYWMFPGILYKKGRAKVLKKMLSVHSIYNSGYFRLKYEEAARSNINYELKELLA